MVDSKIILNWWRIIVCNFVLEIIWIYVTNLIYDDSDSSTVIAHMQEFL